MARRDEKGDEKKFGGAGHGQLFLGLAKKKPEKAKIPPVLVYYARVGSKAPSVGLRSLTVPSVAPSPYIFVRGNLAFSRLLQYIYG
jgi:hypothetical protein